MATKLQKLEHRIEDNIKKAWYENGLCLFEIQRDRLYKKEYSSFDTYCEERWGYSQPRSSQLVNAAKTFQLLEKSHNGNPEFVMTLPANEWQIRPLLSLDSRAEQVHVWATVTRTGAKITAELVKREVEAFKAHPVTVEPVNEDTLLTNETSNKRKVMYAAGSNDECYTPDYGVKAIIPHLNRNHIIWCPFDKEDSQFVIQLQLAGFTVTFSHIDYGQDFYDYEPEQWDVIVSNPPFTSKREIFQRALDLGKPFALIMSNTWLNDAAPKQIFKERGIQLLMFEERMKFLNQDNSVNKITFSSSYFCCDLWDAGRDVKFASLKDYGY